MSSSRLAAPFVTATVIALAACSSSPGGGGGGTGGGQTGSGGTSGSGGAGVDAPPDIAREVPPRDICAGFILNQTRLSDVSVADFCATFTTACRYGLPGAYASHDDCLAKYGAADDGARNCRADNVCVAVGAATARGAPPDAIALLLSRARRGAAP